MTVSPRKRNLLYGLAAMIVAAPLTAGLLILAFVGATSDDPSDRDELLALVLPPAEWLAALLVTVFIALVLRPRQGAWMLVPAAVWAVTAIATVLVFLAPTGGAVATTTAAGEPSTQHRETTGEEPPPGPPPPPPPPQRTTTEQPPIELPGSAIDVDDGVIEITGWCDTNDCPTARGVLVRLTVCAKKDGWKISEHEFTAFGPDGIAVRSNSGPGQQFLGRRTLSADECVKAVMTFPLHQRLEEVYYETDGWTASWEPGPSSPPPRG